MSEPRIVRPLHRLLMRMSVDELTDFLHEMNVDWYMRRVKGDKYEVRIHQPGMLTYQQVGVGTGPKPALVNVMVDFLTNEQADFHDVQQRASNS